MISRITYASYRETKESFSTSRSFKLMISTIKNITNRLEHTKKEVFDTQPVWQPPHSFTENSKTNILRCILEPSTAQTLKSNDQTPIK